eukprot:309635-Rhodomonas_salina.2
MIDSSSLEHVLQEQGSTMYPSSEITASTHSLSPSVSDVIVDEIPESPRLSKEICSNSTTTTFSEREPVQAHSRSVVEESPDSGLPSIRSEWDPFARPDISEGMAKRSIRTIVEHNARPSHLAMQSGGFAGSGYEAALRDNYSQHRETVASVASLASSASDMGQDHPATERKGTHARRVGSCEVGETGKSQRCGVRI